MSRLFWCEVSNDNRQSVTILQFFLKHSELRRGLSLSDRWPRSACLAILEIRMLN